MHMMGIGVVDAISHSNGGGISYPGRKHLINRGCFDRFIRLQSARRHGLLWGSSLVNAVNEQ